MYNVVEPADRHKYMCPTFIEKRLWEQAERENPQPEDCVPVAVIGFQALQERIGHQQQHALGLVNVVNVSEGLGEIAFKSYF